MEERKMRVMEMLREIVELELELMKLKFSMTEFIGRIEGSPKKLRVFKGYIVDERLREFRRVNYGEMPEFISFDSPRGQKLLSEMRGQKSQ